MEFVHHHVFYRKLVPFTERPVREDLRRAAKNRSVLVHRSVARGKPDVLRTEFTAERHPLFVHESLDRACVHGATPARKAFEMERERDKRFTGTRGRIENYVFPVEQFQDRVLLCFIQSNITGPHPIKEPGKKIVRRDAFIFCGERIAQGIKCHAPKIKKDRSIRNGPGINVMYLLLSGKEPLVNIPSKHTAGAVPPNPSRNTLTGNTRRVL